MAHFTSGWSSPGNSPDSAPGGIQPSELAQIRGACSSQPTAEFPFRCIRNWTGSLTSPGSLPSVMALFLGEIFSQFQRNSLQRKRWNIMQLKIVPLTVWKLLSFLYQNWHQDSFYFYTLNAVAKKKKFEQLTLFFIKLSCELDLACPLNLWTAKVFWAPRFRWGDWSSGGPPAPGRWASRTPPTPHLLSPLLPLTVS